MQQLSNVSPAVSFMCRSREDSLLTCVVYEYQHNNRGPSPTVATRVQLYRQATAQLYATTRERAATAALRCRFLPVHLTNFYSNISILAGPVAHRITHTRSSYYCMTYVYT